MASAVTAIAIGQHNATTNSVFVGMANGTLSLIMVRIIYAQVGVFPIKKNLNLWFLVQGSSW